MLSGLCPNITINLADEDIYSQFVGNPGELRSRVLPLLRGADNVTIFIDEAQRIPTLLNTIQALLDEHRTRLRFLLSGSSARKLRRGQANLLPGRIHSYQLGPIVSAELDYQMPTERILSLGSLPGILTDLEEGSAQKTLRTYGATYLKEEIQAEALSRNIEGFARFLKVVTSWSSELVDFSKVASLAGISRQTATRYFEILEDTLIFHRIEPFAKSARIRLVQHPKYYIFDVGVLNGLLGNFICSDDRIERLFETLGLQMTCLTIHLNSRPSPI